MITYPARYYVKSDVSTGLGGGLLKMKVCAEVRRTNLAAITVLYILRVRF